MSNSASVVEVNVFERLLKLWAMTCKMIMDGLRDAGQVADLLQTVVNTTDFSPKKKEIYLKQFALRRLQDAMGTETFETPGLFKEQKDVPSLPVPDEAKGRRTRWANTYVWDIVKFGTYRAIWKSLGDNRQLWTESQIVWFCHDHRDVFKDVLAVYFEMEGNVLVGVRLDTDDDYFTRNIFHPGSDGGVWHGKYRLVSLPERMLFTD